MTCYMVINGIKQEMDEDEFDEMVEVLHQPISYEQTPQRTRRRGDGTYDGKPLDPNYFQNCYRNNLPKPFKCPDCGRTISSKTNLSKHRQTKVCEKNRNQRFNVET